MNLCVLAFVAGTVIVARLPVLPAADASLILIAASVILLFSRKTRWLAALAGGVLYSSFVLDERIDARIPREIEGQDILIEGVVTSLPRTSDRATRFRFELSDCGECWSPGSTIDLAWYDRSVAVEPGQRWQFVVRLNRPRGSVNPGLFDYEGWLLSEGVVARGYVRTGGTAARLVGHNSFSVVHHQLRYWLRECIRPILEDHPRRGLLLALLIGESNEISTVDWRKLSATGTNHLLIISGLHVGLVAGTSFKLFAWVLSVFVSDSRRWAGVLALVVAIGYGMVAGMGLPVQRAIVMATVALSGVILHRNVKLQGMFSLALFFVVLLDPLASIRAGFWLSFGAVFSLIYFFTGRNESGRIARRALSLATTLVTTQYVVWLGTLPLLLWVVAQASISALIVNLVAIPWISLSVIPLLLLAIPAYAFSPDAGDLVVGIAAHSLDALWHIVSAFADLDAVHYAERLAPWQIALGLLGSLLLLAPSGSGPRWPGLLMVIQLVAPAPMRGPLTITVLDVGQGLSVIANRPGYRMIYDAGPRFGSGFDAGEQIVLPSLRRSGSSRHLDMLVVSHGDMDHAGGADVLRDRLVISSVVSDGSFPADRNCQQIGPVHRDGMQLRFIRMPASAESNEQSCVLLLEYQSFAILLPGDIERAGERHLLRESLPDIDVLVAPHHGSASSSSPAFLNHIQPKVVIFSTGYNNRFNHPDPAVLARYRARGVRTFNTAETGAITIHYLDDGKFRIDEERTRSKRFWYDQPPGFSKQLDEL